MANGPSLLLRVARAIIGTVSYIFCIPLVLVMLLPWRDAQGAGAAWATIGAYVVLVVALVWGFA